MPTWRRLFLSGAHLEGANFREAHLEGADLRGATGLTREQLAEAIIDEKTILPDYLQEEPHEAKGPEGNRRGIAIQAGEQVRLRQAGTEARPTRHKKRGTQLVAPTFYIRDWGGGLGEGKGRRPLAPSPKVFLYHPMVR